MARRIALTMLALVGALLLGAVVPLGLITTARERASFRQDTVLTARAFAATAEDYREPAGYRYADEDEQYRHREPAGYRYADEDEQYRHRERQGSAP
jgi:hypothetical protein